MMKTKDIAFSLGIAILVVYLVYVIYPFYQRYWASITYGDSKNGKRFVDNLEEIAYGLTFEEAEELANELRKPIADRRGFSRLAVNPYRKLPADYNEIPKNEFKKNA